MIRLAGTLLDHFFSSGNWMVVVLSLVFVCLQLGVFSRPFEALPGQIVSHLPLVALHTHLTSTPGITTTSFSSDLAELEDQQHALKILYNLQPTHRDVLINLSLIAFYQGRPAEHELWWKRALATDPNHPLFAE